MSIYQMKSMQRAHPTRTETAGSSTLVSLAASHRVHTSGVAVPIQKVDDMHRAHQTRSETAWGSLLASRLVQTVLRRLPMEQMDDV